MNRRTFLATTGAAAAAAVAPVRTIASASIGAQTPAPKARFRTGLVAYSFRQGLQAKTMTYEDLIRIAVETAAPVASESPIRYVHLPPLLSGK